MFFVSQQNFLTMPASLATLLLALQFSPSSAVAQSDQDAKLIGASVISSDERLAGAVDQVVQGQNGQTMLVVGLAGYLGLGEKDVAIPAQSFQTSRRTGIPRTFVAGEYGGAKFERVHVPMTLQALESQPAYTAPSGAGQPSSTSTSPAATPSQPPSSTRSGGPG